MRTIFAGHLLRQGNCRAGIPFRQQQDDAAKNPRWVPDIAQDTTASISAHIHTTVAAEAANVIFRFGIWPAARAIWSSSGYTWTKISWNTTSTTAQPGPTNLLFPFVTSQAGFDTAIAISNTSADPFSTATQTGTCTLSVYSTGTTPITSVSPNIAPGTTFTTLMSVIAPNVQGYVFAACTFTYAHGFAFISDIGARTLATSYLALIVQTPRPNGENLNE
jgi:hypothetical protein